MNQHTCVITGATSGIGKAAVLALAKQDWRLILIGRNVERTARVCAEIKRKAQNGHVHGYVCDLSVLWDVRQLAARIKDEHNQIDVLINNAGARFLRHQLTKEGVEMTLATNHLGHYILTLSLIEALKNSKGARIINVSSGAHYAGTGVIENILSAKDYDGRKQYANSKLANVLFTYALAEKLKGRGIGVNAVDPGGVATDFARNNGWVPWLRHRISLLRSRQYRTPAQGAETIVRLALSEDLAGVTGKYFKDRKEQGSSELSYDLAVQDRLWALSAELGGIDLA
jgi:NAD(P)-dependent dehydrogenase (short-subunit alcohol dehydrogenase family)